jgi:hypothetical protein
MQLHTLAVFGLALVVNVTACEEDAQVRVRRPQAEYVVAAPQPRVTEVVTVAQPQVVVQQPRVTEVVTVAQPRTEVVTVAAQPRVVEEVVVQEGPPAAHIRMAPQVVYEGRRVYWYGNRWYYQNGARWSYYGAEPVALRGRRYVLAP